MRAVQLAAVNRLAVAEVADPRPGAGEVIVALRAAALNHRDVWIKTGQYAGLKWPCIPGSDGAGTVVSLGDGVEGAWLGREVIINPGFNWGDSERMQGPQFSILGLPRDGTLAERTVRSAITAKAAHLTWKSRGAAAGRPDGVGHSSPHQRSRVRS